MVLYKCNRCGKEFNRKSNYNYHINRKRPCAPKFSKRSLKNPPKFRCSNCDKLYTTKYNLNRHLKNACKVLKGKIKNEKNLKHFEEGDEQRLNRSLNDMNTIENGENSDIEKIESSLKKDISSMKNTKTKCEYCKRYITKKNISRHKKRCMNDEKYKLQKIVEEKEEKEKSYQEEIKQKDEKIKKIEEELEALKHEYFEFTKEMARNNNVIQNSNKSVNMSFIKKNYNNAKNFEEVMDPALTDDEIREIKQFGVKVGVYNLLNNRCINGINVEDRPFHCVDESRNKYLLRTSNDWIVDKNADQIMNKAREKVDEVVDTKIERGDSMEKIERNVKNITELLDFEKKGKKRLLKELNKETNIKNNVK